MKKLTTAIFLIFFVSVSAQELHKYECISNQWGTMDYTKQYDRKFDSLGIITQKNEYHALTISVFGVLCYDEFLSTGDSMYYHKVIDQYNYFKDTSRLMFFDDGKSVGLPYHFNFHDMKAPWFSGMTQGFAISYLLRYYDLTQDESAHELIQKLARFMLKSETEGGSISTTAEGGTWIEEYPNSQKSKSVLNGFVNGLIGLYEYTLFYPEDTLATRIYNESYNSLFQSLPEYDTPTWTNYNRNKRGVSKLYMRYQLSEFDHMYRLFNDDRFRSQMRVWSPLAHNKIDNELVFYRYPQYQYAVPLVINTSDDFIFADTTRFKNSLIELNVNQIEEKKIKKEITYNFSSPAFYSNITINKKLDPSKVKFTFYNGSREVDAKYTLSDTLITFESTEGVTSFQAKYKRRLKRNIYKSIKVYDSRTYQLPMFAFHHFEDKVRLPAGKLLVFKVNGVNLVNAKVYYKVARSHRDLPTAKFRYDQYFDLNAGGFEVDQSGVYQFYIIYDIQHPISGLFDYSIELLD